MVSEIKTMLYVYDKDRSDYGPNQFMVEDIFSFLDSLGIEADVYEITDIYVAPENRRRGRGRALIKERAEKNANCVIVAAAGASVTEFPEKPSGETIGRVLEGLSEFYTKCGFEDVNDYIGGYDDKRAFLYTGNEIGRIVYGEVARFRTRDAKRLSGL